jgi:Leucine-rich repeat (LRR) protein
MSAGFAVCNLQSRQLLNCPAEVLLRSTVLTSLNLSRNKIVTLPRNINCLSILQSLELDCNQLEQVPHEIGYIHTLQNLSIRNNVLISVPRSFGFLTSIKSLYLSANNLTMIPPELFVHLPRCVAFCLCNCVGVDNNFATALRSAGSAKTGLKFFPNQILVNNTTFQGCSNFGST